jgi:hypothetical protein
MKYRFRASETFWENFYRLPADQEAAVRRAWQIFKLDPFDPRLRPHRIHRLSSHYRRTVYAVVIEQDLRAVFYVDSELVYTIDLGTHDLYKQ